MLYSTCENNFYSTRQKPILNCMSFCLLRCMRDLQYIADYVNDNYFKTYCLFQSLYSSKVAETITALRLPLFIKKGVSGIKQ